MNYKIFLAHLIVALLFINYSYGQEVGIKDTEQFTVTSNVNATSYVINVFLPRSYNSDRSKSYPVVFILDAEYNFGMVSYGTRRLIKEELIPEVILIGIENDTTYAGYTSLRQRDYTPTKTRIPSTGGGVAFLDFIIKELIPEVKSKYRISDDRTIVGHSLGGLIGFYAMLKQPHIFNRYLLVSPSLWYDNNMIFNLIKDSSLTDPYSPIIYTSIGSFETIESGQAHDMVDDLKKFVDLINDSDLNCTMEILDNETHRSVFPRAFMNGMRILFNQESD